MHMHCCHLNKPSNDQGGQLKDNDGPNALSSYLHD